MIALIIVQSCAEWLDQIIFLIRCQVDVSPQPRVMVMMMMIMKA